MKLDKSRELYERSSRSLAGGVSSTTRMGGPTRLFFERGEGSHLYDADGNDYIDYLLGSGPDIFGHSPQFLREAVVAAMQNGQIFGAQHPTEVRVSETIQKIVPSAELVRYATSGTEAVQAAIRLARAYTGQHKFIKFEGHYHGWMDSVGYLPNPSLDEPGGDEMPPPVPISAGVTPGTADEILLLPWNDTEVLREVVKREADQLAAIITEPIMCNTNTVFPRPGYLEEMRQLCDDHGIVLVFDEVITGFRVALGGAQEMLGVTPDLSTFAKAMAGGYPVSMVVGRRDIMSLLADKTVFHGGTLNSNFMAMAAAEAALEKLIEDDGAVYKQLYATGNRLIEGLRELGLRHEQPILVQGAGPTFTLAFTDAEEITDYRTHQQEVDHDKGLRFFEGMLERGVHLVPNGRFFVSTAHTEEDIQKTLSAADEVLAEL